MRKFCILTICVLSLTTYAFSQQVQWAKTIIGFSSENKNQKDPKQYNSIQVLGKPTRYPVFSGTTCAWVPANAESDNAEWIHVGYEKPMQIQQVVVAEPANAGCIVKIELYDDAGAIHTLFENATPPKPVESGRFNYFFTDRTSYKVASVKVTLNTKLVTGFEYIDAIGIADSRDSVKLKINLITGYNQVSAREDLGDAINSPTDDLSPVISYDGKTLFFTRQNHPENIPPVTNQDIWFSERLADNTFSPPRKAEAPINTSENNSILGITPDGQKILLLNVFNPDGKVTKGVSISRKTETGWGSPEKVEIENFYNHNQYGEYNLSPSGKILVMTIQRDTGEGSKDIHVSFLQPNGTWSEPKNLGAVVNTAESEVSPFLAADERTLYYSTKGLPGYGSNDVFMTQRLDDTWQNWSEPKNLGPDLNTPNWDAYYIFTADGSYVYFVSSGKNKSMDIFRKKLPAGARPDPVVLIKGKVLDVKTKQPLTSRISYQNMVTGENLGFANSSAVDGYYSIVLQAGKRYEFLADASGYYPISENIDLGKLTSFKEINRDLYLAPIEKGMVVRLNNLFFDFNKSELKQESYAELNRLISLLNDNPAMKIEIAGHTDNVGTDAYNNPLSLKRAQAVYNFLINKGVTPSRIAAKGYGKTKPLKVGDTEEIRSLNRRVEFVIAELN